MPEEPKVKKVDNKKINPMKWLKDKKLLFPLISLAAVIVFGASVWGLASWYQNPEKVLADSMINAVTSGASVYTGTIRAENGSDFSLAIDITTKQLGSAGSLAAKVSVDAGGKKYSVGGDALYDKSGDIYFKVSNLGSIIAEAKSSMYLDSSSQISSAVDKFVSKVDNKWIKISSDDLKQFNQSYSTSKTCMNRAIDEFVNDKTSKDQVADLYRKNAYIVIDKELGRKDGSFGYQLKLSNAKLKSFMKGFKDTKIYKSLHDCDSSFVVNENDIPEDSDTTTSDGRVTVWVDAWSHKFTKLEASSGSESSTFNATIRPDYSQKVTVTAPSDSISLTQLKTYIEDLTNSFTDLYMTQST